jgi:hypothetical protein
MPERHRVRYPVLRWCALLWLAVYVPVYSSVYGAWHFLMLCNLGVLLTCAGLVTGKQWLLSGPAVAAPSIALLWLADAVARLATGSHLHGGTGYLWDEQLPVPVRVLSLYHLAWPFLLAWCLHRHGYDRRGLWLQASLATLAFAIGLWLAPAAENLNYVLQWPGAPRPHAQPLLQAGLSLAMLVVGLYWPTHLLLKRLFRAPAAAAIG